MTKQNNKRSHVTENDKTVVEKRQFRQKVTKQKEYNNDKPEPKSKYHGHEIY